MKKKLVIPLLAAATLFSANAQSSDNGNGTFTNPVLWADLPDPDVIQVGDTFYFVSTSMHLLPGVTLLQSTDLVNWSFATNVVPQFDDDPYFDLRGGNRYGKGQWATALRYWGGEFHVLFTSNTNGTFIYSSADIKGPWQKTTIYDAPYHPLIDRFEPLRHQDQGDGYSHHILYDPGFLVDNDNRIYVVHGNSLNYITEIDPVTCQPLGPERLLFQAHRPGLEGNRPYHIGDYYYVICTYGGSHSGNVTCLRSRSLEGPWEEREVMCEGARYPESHILQACLIPLESGETWAMAFMDMGVLGRIPHLVPVHWCDGWPIFGGVDGNLTFRKPLIHKGQTQPEAHPERQTLATSDDFSSSELGLQWQFNHNPDITTYSLTERPGWLRLHAQKAHQPLGNKDKDNPLINNDLPISVSAVNVSLEAPLLMARNTLTQRLFGPYDQATVKVDASHLKEGDEAGLAILNIPYGTLTISRKGSGFTLRQTWGDENQVMTNGEVSITTKEASSLWLRVQTQATSALADFSYSLDGIHFTSLGQTFHMVYSGSYFVGNRFALFCYNTRQKGGYLDIDSFDTTIEPLFERKIAPGTTLQAAWTDVLWRTECRWATDNDSAMEVAWTGDGGMIAFDDMQVTGQIREVGFKLRNVSAHNVMVELRDNQTGKVLGTADLPEPTQDYSVIPMPLNTPLISGHRLEIRIWNKDWDVPTMGEVIVDELMFR